MYAQNIDKFPVHLKHLDENDIPLIFRIHTAIAYKHIDIHLMLFSFSSCKLIMCAYDWCIHTHFCAYGKQRGRFCGMCVAFCCTERAANVYHLITPINWRLIELYMVCK